MSENNLEISNGNGVKTVENKTNDRLTVKFDLWERKLLDLSTRNSLLNLRIKGSCIPLFVPDCANIEDWIAQEKSFSIKSRGKDDETAEEIEEETEEKSEPAAEKTEPTKTEKKKIKGIPAKDYSIVDLQDITEFGEYINKNYVICYR